MSTDSISWFRPRAVSLSFPETVHSWVTTVDHKRLGAMYILYGLIFLIIGLMAARKIID